MKKRSIILAGILAGIWFAIWLSRRACGGQGETESLTEPTEVRAA